ncbi:MAG: DUF2281 domain-containing protein [bacterium]
MTEAEKLKLEERMKQLPEEARAEVYDFIEFLARKHREKTTSDAVKQGQENLYKEAEDVLLELGEGLGEGPADLSEKHNRYLY